MNRVIFITEYTANSKRDLVSAPSICYTEYIVDLIKRSGRYINIISYSGGNGRSYFCQEHHNKDQYEKDIYLATLNVRKGKLIMRLSQILMLIQIFFYVIFKTKDSDCILIYHSKFISEFFYFVRKVIRRKYYYVVGEIFSAVYEKGDKCIERELNTLRDADGYIFSNSVLPDFLRNDNFVVIHGDYRTKENHVEKKVNDVINVVYAGKIDNKYVKDAFIAVEAARYLDRSYHLYILGYGKKQDIEQLQDRISQINKIKGYNIVSYEGCLSGKEYDQFLMKCSIGLSTRTLGDKVSNYCFPSKTVVYIANGLIPICPNLHVLRHSEVSNLIRFLDKTLSEDDIATYIKSISEYDIVEFQKTNIFFLKQLDDKCLNKISSMFRD